MDINKILAMIPGNNYKTIVGVLGLIVCYCLQAKGVIVSDYIFKAFQGLVAIGLIHKLEKVKEDISQLKGDMTDSIDSLTESIKPEEKKCEQSPVQSSQPQ